MTDDPNAVASQRIQEKFDFYALGLTFTVLGLSIQTAATGRNPVADASELLAWLALLASGILGVSRIESAIHVYRMYALRQRAEAYRAQIQQAAESGSHSVAVVDTGRVRPITEEFGGADQSVKRGNAAIERGQSQAQSLYRWQRRTLIAGFGLLVLARAFVPATRLALAIVHRSWTAYF